MLLALGASSGCERTYASDGTRYQIAAAGEPVKGFPMTWRLDTYSGDVCVFAWHDGEKGAIVMNLGCLSAPHPH